MHIKNLSRFLQDRFVILHETCKMDLNLAKILQNAWKKYAFSRKIAGMILEKL